jgi:drug/metabolite transporter (DMT)-like permease
MLAVRHGNARMSHAPTPLAPLLIALTLIWGSNWPMMKLSLREVGPLWFRALTMLGGVVLLALWVAWRGVRLRAARQELRPLAVLALPNVVGWHLGSVVGLSMLPAGRAGILAFTMPVWTVVLGALLFGLGLGRRAIVASVFALAAVGLLVMQEALSLAGAPQGVLWLQAAAALWALGTLLMKRHRLTLAPEAITVSMMAMACPVFFALAWAFEPLPQPAQWTGVMWATMAWGVVMNFAISQALWFTLSSRMTPQASTFSMMAVPLVGLALSMPLIGEVPRWSDAVAALLIVGAIAAVHAPKMRA